MGRFPLSFEKLSFPHTMRFYDGNGQKQDVKADDIDVYEKIPNENPLTEDQAWLKENLGTGEREIVFETPYELKDDSEESQS